MQKNSSSYREGDIVVLELPFTDLTGRKLRPVLILSSESLNLMSTDVIVAKISSSKHFPEFEIEIKPEDVENGKLRKVSYIHCHTIFTVEKNLIIKKIGRISSRKLIEVKNVIKKVFSI